ncbi:MAG: bifunctional fucokinase/L-fucose-1-P-guanylyltransferase, partial [Paramuribaculum sp.]|nr:bifunctional fucokinase/L-fucose-1-P-guanylyltransferase [Paramuribaculum sp.]
KSLTPLPVLRWAVGEKIDQSLLDLQLPLLRQIMDGASDRQSTLVVSGDVLIRAGGKLPPVPDADVVCYGLWSEAEQAVNHGVFFIPREDSSGTSLEFMLQKPAAEEIARLGRTHYYLMDVGLWLLSDRAMDVLRQRSTDIDGSFRFYDLYSQFGCALGDCPSASDPDVASLSVAVVPLLDGEFYHFGTTPQLISSTLALQNIVADQRRIIHNRTKPNPALFVQNCKMGIRLTGSNNNVWIENSCIGSRWRLSSENVVTGVPANDWTLELKPGICLDMVPIGATGFAVRPYGYADPMRGLVSDKSTLYLGESIHSWLNARSVRLPDDCDLQSAPLFPVVGSVEDAGIVARWMTSEPDLEQGRDIWMASPRMSADALMDGADLRRLYEQRRGFLQQNLKMLNENPDSVFYQLDLDDVARKYVQFGLDMPDEVAAGRLETRRFQNHSLRSRILQISGRPFDAEQQKAFNVMSDMILSTMDVRSVTPRLSVSPDRIVWGRSPVRIDLAGGWTDTPPYSLLHGGSVVNMAVELNGQPPLQIFVKPSAERHILLRSIDLGASEILRDYDSVIDFRRVGAPFSLPKAALAIAGFAPGFSSHRYATLEEQLEDFGSGLEITLLSALPAGSGMGTSSILAATVLGSLSDFCGLGWTADDVCERTLALEQLLTTGGGWQDQYGGVLQGVKLLQTSEGREQSPRISWLPEGIFNDPQYAPCHILYYTGLTRTAKNILAEIVRKMFLNHGPTLSLLHDMKAHSLEVADAVQRREFGRFGHLIDRTWRQNCLLDPGTCPPAVAAIVDEVRDLTLGLKLPGAGGGGYLYMVAKDPEAAALIRQRLAARAAGRFAEMQISQTGLKISRS